MRQSSFIDGTFRKHHKRTRKGWVKDVIIVGAGAAGLGAARAMREAGLEEVAVLEAKPRIGGRAWTDTATCEVPLDWGGHWLHSADINPFTEMARQWGFVYRTGTG